MISKISSAENNFTLTNVETRKPKGFWLSPYPLLSLIRYLANYLLNGRLSYINPDRDKMKLLGKEGRINLLNVDNSSQTRVKVAFLGDIMVSKSGNPPQMDEALQKLLERADIIVANVEAPVVSSNKPLTRGLSLNFAMNNFYLANIAACNRTAQWVFNIANNHACDTCKSPEDINGIEESIKSIKTVIPAAEVIGAEIGSAKSVLSLKVKNGPRIGIVGWTGLMNNDWKHYKKKIVRETDLTHKVVKEIKQKNDVLIGFPHGNEEQSYYPLKKVRDYWMSLIGTDKFDLIVGHGPHVVHPAERVEEHGLLFNSIGNFCSPVGPSQTKVGCIPIIDFQYQGDKISAIKYSVNFIEQQKDNLSLFNDEKVPAYPHIMRRLKKF